MSKYVDIEQIMPYIEDTVMCSICQNPMHNDNGCDGNCVINDFVFNEITGALSHTFEILSKDGMFTLPTCESCSQGEKTGKNEAIWCNEHKRIVKSTDFCSFRIGKDKILWENPFGTT